MIKFLLVNILLEASWPTTTVAALYLDHPVFAGWALFGAFVSGYGFYKKES